MTKTIAVEIHDPIQIRFPDDKLPRTYASRIENFSGEEILATWPAENGIQIPLCGQEELIVSFIHSGTAFEFRAIVQSRIPDPQPLLGLKVISPVQSVERREDVRVKTSVQVELNARVVPMVRLIHPRDRIPALSAETITLSGSGFAILSNSSIPIGALFNANLAIPGRPQPLPMSAKVVRCNRVAESHSGDLFEVGFVYARIAEAVRSQIVSYVFKTQQAANQK
jgi:c-di-GMP-binding flagellar brake protein YcgR